MKHVNDSSYSAYLAIHLMASTMASKQYFGGSTLSEKQFVTRIVEGRRVPDSVEIQKYFPNYLLGSHLTPKQELAIKSLAAKWQNGNVRSSSLAEDMRGTKKSIAQVAKEANLEIKELSEAEVKNIHAQVFRCTNCQKWERTIALKLNDHFPVCPSCNSKLNN